MFYPCTQWTNSARGTKVEDEGKDEHIIETLYSRPHCNISE